MSTNNGHFFNMISIDYTNQSQPSLPTSSPVEGCNDSPFRFRLRKDGKRITRGCAWVAKKMQSIDVHYMDFHPCVRILVVIVNALMEKQDLYFLGIIV